MECCIITIGFEQWNVYKLMFYSDYLVAFLIGLLGSMCMAFLWKTENIGLS